VLYSFLDVSHCTFFANDVGKRAENVYNYPCWKFVPAGVYFYSAIFLCLATIRLGGTVASVGNAEWFINDDSYFLVVGPLQKMGRKSRLIRGYLWGVCLVCGMLIEAY
jgi:hypothetical protein